MLFAFVRTPPGSAHAAGSGEPPVEQPQLSRAVLRKRAVRYASTWMVLDVVSVLPYDWFIAAAAAAAGVPPPSALKLKLAKARARPRLLARLFARCRATSGGRCPPPRAQLPRLIRLRRLAETVTRTAHAGRAPRRRLMSHVGTGRRHCRDAPLSSRGRRQGVSPGRAGGGDAHHGALGRLQPVVHHHLGHRERATLRRRAPHGRALIRPCATVRATAAAARGPTPCPLAGLLPIALRDYRRGASYSAGADAAQAGVRPPARAAARRPARGCTSPLERSAAASRAAARLTSRRRVPRARGWPPRHGCGSASARTRPGSGRCTART